MGTGTYLRAYLESYDGEYVRVPNVTDHLGNVRAVVTNGNVVERNEYYPFDGVKDVRLASFPYGVILALNSPEMIQILLNWGEIKENCLHYFYIWV